MESLSDTIWDVVICGTGMQQSLLALALSRSNKNILHIDPNGYYGGSEAALSLSEADAWAAARPEASVTRPASAAEGGVPKLGPLSAYSVALAPQFVHARSALVDLLVSSRAFRQLEFLAVSSFYVLEASSTPPHQPVIVRIPATREDVFANTAMPVRAKRQLMKFLKFVLAYDGEDKAEGLGGDKKTGGESLWWAHALEPLGAFLQSNFGLDDRLRDNVLALTLSLDGASVTVAEGLARLHRHISSMGLFGPGFAAVYPKWGGCGEIVQVACRAAAVGGGIYMLGSGIRSIKTVASDGENSTASQAELLELDLTRDMTIKTKLLVRGSEEIVEVPSEPVTGPAVADSREQQLSRLIAVVGAPLPFLFAPTVEGAPVAGGAVIALPAGRPIKADGPVPEHPIFVMAHSSDTGECPTGQSVLHFTTIGTERSKATLESALGAVLAALVHEVDSNDASGQNESPLIPCLYKLYYEQPRGGSGASAASEEATKGEFGPTSVFRFPPLPVDLVVQDAPLGVVRDAWKRVMGGDADDATYMAFEDREGNAADNIEYD
ncbi:Rab proteins geranylgeranyltransferase component A [Sporothrix curviconia]|uniref:Rab proteins geranylgeranyltransferase n=1 Tax=Sporothrix curviconia TaxID=1260050 RepID=A0ABP0CZD6_9PEZI